MSGLSTLLGAWRCSTFTWANPHYHRRCFVSLLSSAWGQVVPKRYSHQANSFVQMFNGVAILFAQGAYLLTIVVKRHTLLKFGKLFLLSQFVKLSTLVFVSFLRDHSTSVGPTSMDGGG